VLPQQLDLGGRHPGGREHLVGVLAKARRRP
jgi:hypothetical protein